MCFRIYTVLCCIIHIASCLGAENSDWSRSYGGAVQAGSFESSNLRANVEGIIGKLKFVVSDTGELSQNSYRLLVSRGPKGRWMKRRWEVFDLRKRGAGLETWLPVESVNLPVFFYVKSINANGSVSLGPIQRVVPLDLDIEKPSRPFWPFLEGFENSTGAWTIGSEVTLSKKEAYSGKASLKVGFAQGRYQTSISTDLIQGWHWSFVETEGLRIWCRSEGGAATLGLAVEVENEEGTSLMVFPHRYPLSEHWEALDFDLSQIRHLDMASIVRIHFEIRSTLRESVFLDDLQLLGIGLFRR